jgi:hypothetical protein
MKLPTQNIWCRNNAGSHGFTGREPKWLQVQVSF